MTTTDLIFQPPQTKKALHQYLVTYLSVDLSDNLVDPESKTSPMEAVWQVYRSMLTGQAPHSFVACATRNGGKTLIGSVLTFLGMVLFRRKVVIMAAIKSQSAQMLRYLDSHLRKTPEIAPYFSSDSTTQKEVANLPYNAYTVKNKYAFCTVVAATLAGANAQRGNLLILDEVDLTPPKILSEVAGVLDPTMDEHKFNPVVIALSSRKVPDGPLQDRINKAEKQPDRHMLLKWSLADMIDPCPHKKENLENPTSTALISNESLEVMWDTSLEDIDETQRGNWYQRKQWKRCKGCLDGVTYKVCQGLSMNAISESSPMRRRTEFAVQIVEEVGDPVVLVAQYNNWKPETRGSVYRMFKRDKHTGPLQTIYRWAMSLPKTMGIPQGLTWHSFGRLLKQAGWNLTIGMDYGYHPDPATALFVAYNATTKKAIVLHALYANYYADNDWSDNVIQYAKRHNFPAEIYCPDTHNGAVADFLVKKGKRVQPKPARIETGVSQIRGLLQNPKSDDISLMILDDGSEAIKKLMTEMETWRHAKNAVTGEWDTTKFEKGNDHGLDALRYSLNPFCSSTETNQVFFESYTITEAEDLEQPFSEKVQEASDMIQVHQENVTGLIEEVIKQQSGMQINLHAQEEDDPNESSFFIG